MVILSEGWFQFILITSCIVLLAVTLFIVHRNIQKRSGDTRGRERTSSFLVFITVLTLYFAISVFVPTVYSGDVVIADNQEEHIEQEQARYVSLGSVYRVHAIDTRDYTRDIQDRTVAFQIQSFQPLYEVVSEHDDFIRSDGTIDVASYIDDVVLPVFEQLEAEEVTLTQLRESLPHIDITIE
ncbi:hypothetical protein ACE1TH_02730 [Shouchella sp. JSM 1781072]|uniref:hypothetical protein n=1 Tax=Bacillaceae TaxID=186817 RepID=UPI000C06BDA3|nr:MULTISPECIES: hypothetical protein [Bacillaceae]UTR05058.1 hypothetical protein MM326_13155 [Alkalihalobacillus sp. LMS6]